MKRRHHTPEQVIRKLAEGEKLLAQGKSVEEVCRRRTQRPVRSNVSHSPTGCSRRSGAGLTAPFVKGCVADGHLCGEIVHRLAGPHSLTGLVQKFARAERVAVQRPAASAAL